MAKRTTITIVTDTVVLLHALRPVRAWCPSCTAFAEMVLPADLEEFASWNNPDLAGWRDSTELHWSRQTDGESLVCLKSFLACIHTKPRGFPPPRITRKEEK